MREFMTETFPRSSAFWWPDTRSVITVTFQDPATVPGMARPSSIKTDPVRVAISWVATRPSAVAANESI